MSRLFYIVSVKWTRRDQPYITFWRPNDCGYAYPLSWAGKYAEQDVLAHPGYYNNGSSTIAVPCEVVDAIAIPEPMPGWIDGDAGPVVPNSRANWQRLMAAVIFEPKVKPKPQPQYQRKSRQAREVA